MHSSVRPRNITFPLGCLLGIAGIAAASAAEVPDAGNMLRELQPPVLTLPGSATPALDVQPPAQPAPLPSAVRVRVDRIAITGTTVYTEAQLLPLLQDSLGEELDLADLDALAARLTRYYRARGYSFARAYLPPQDIHGGTVQVAVIEGRYGQIALQNRSAVSDSTLGRRIGGLATGAVIDAGTLERDLLLLSDMPGVAIHSTLKPGATVGTADLLIDAAPGKRYSGAVDADNFGNRHTGAGRLNGTLNLNSPAGIGDLLEVRATTSGKGLANGRVQYRIPFGPRGTAIGAAYSQLRYELGSDFASLDAHGSARIASVFAEHPLARGRRFNLVLQAGFHVKALRDDVGSIGTSAVKHVDHLSLGLSGDARDEWMGGAVNSFSAAYAAGRVRIDDAATRAVDAASARSAGHFSKLRIGALRLQRLTDTAGLYLSLSGQLASKNLTSSEKFSLGGAYGVRAFPQGEAAGDVGALATVELRYTAAPAMQLTGFIDSGHVTFNHDNYAGDDNQRTLSGAGVGLNWLRGERFALHLNAAWKLGGARPDTDTDRSPRVWLQASTYF